MAAASGGSGGLKGEEVLKHQLKICGFKKSNDVTELYLGERGLKEVPDLSQFRILTYLWLNNNKIEKLTFLKHNCYLRELYLNNNEIRNIADLFNNCLSQDCRYRLYVIYHLPSVLLFDRKEITAEERSLALNIYNHKQTFVLQSIGFGKRIDVPLLPKAPFNKSWPLTKVLRLPPGCEFGNHLVKIPFENPEDAVFVRAMKRSIMEFRTVNWDKVPTSEEKYLGTKPEKHPERLTVKFR
ncbi:leucine-rich repeat-containing protein 72 isoform X3 [Sphaerodactylus townsendi]|uniref:leucine-rich repeat-containing protein 72 isoform X3 n=1 Tax=Sphaerodactylus townsendi TaxID=933632 RepID=UPI0020272BC4|nr:leucine-rich repeat-containing protein 72 isoform X3 [Sphaerodactylus townsendi]